MNHEEHEEHEEKNLHRDNAAEIVMRLVRWIVNAVLRFRRDLREIDDTLTRR